MKLFLERMLKSFDYQSLGELGQSLAPSQKYHMSAVCMIMSSILVPVDVFADRVFGLDGLAFVALIIVFLTELISGLAASAYRKDPISSMKLSRFSLKVFYYMVMIAVPYLLARSFQDRHKEMASTVFEWLHIFLVIQIVFENIISILENSAVLTGKDKTHIILKIQNKINSLFS